MNRAKTAAAHSPPESELWPESCRGKNWTWKEARFYVYRCQLCVYSCQPSAGRRQLDRLANLPTFLVCMPEQNYANMGPHGGKSGYVGVYPRGGKWEARIPWRGPYFFGAVEAARARDRKA